MRRRDFLASATTATLLSRPRPARAQDKRVLRFIPQANLTSLDPIWTTAAVTGLHGYYVFDTLFALDEKGDVQPQMAERFGASDDGRQARLIAPILALPFISARVSRAIACCTPLPFR